MLSTNEIQETNSLIQDATTKNGRLYFPNKESLAATYKELKNQNIEAVQKFVNEKGIEYITSKDLFRISINYNILSLFSDYYKK
ncbi:hypothetical protein IMZ16_09595 [Cruoricaptor ignavus]|uniref:Uncharacterized protein n=1 Tax=Cruoricaptor ignavus TaxID=1118202 RepID=A0A7M1T1M8_9FLAO|nr:hypothetical protein [Cruoricaptor ignavus]QOR73750.1 hypothetical protein IMZ16_09595 [Cruoricaptor ignavus]